LHSRNTGSKEIKKHKSDVEQKYPQNSQYMYHNKCKINAFPLQQYLSNNTVRFPWFVALADGHNMEKFN